MRRTGSRGRGRVASAGLCLLALSFAACENVSVVQGVDEREANRVVAALDGAGIAAEKSPAEEGGGGNATGFRVRVQADDVARAVVVLEAAALPRDPQPGFQQTLGAPSMVRSAGEERLRGEQAIAGEVARTLASLDGVLDARVHLSSPEPDPLADPARRTRPSASVLVRHTGPRPPLDEVAIRRLVSGAVAGLGADDVQLVVVPTPTNAAVLQRPGNGLAWVGPFAVAATSAGRLRAALVALLLVNVLSAAAVVGLVLSRRRADAAEK